MLQWLDDKLPRWRFKQYGTWICTLIGVIFAALALERFLGISANGFVQNLTPLTLMFLWAWRSDYEELL